MSFDFQCWASEIIFRKTGMAVLLQSFQPDVWLWLLNAIKHTTDSVLFIYITFNGYKKSIFSLILYKCESDNVSMPGLQYTFTAFQKALKTFFCVYMLTLFVYNFDTPHSYVYLHKSFYFKNYTIYIFQQRCACAFSKFAHKPHKTRFIFGDQRQRDKIEGYVLGE